MKLDDGGSAIVCVNERVRRCRCGKRATRLCDWRTGRGRTCDVPICDDCATSPKEGKDLCPAHAEAWKHHPRNPKREGSHAR